MQYVNKRKSYKKKEEIPLNRVALVSVFNVFETLHKGLYFFFNAIRGERKHLQHFFRKMGNGQKANFFLFEAKSLGLFKCISLLIKYYMFNEK